MTKKIALLTVLNVAVGTAAYAGTPSTVSFVSSSPSPTSSNVGARTRGGGLGATNPDVPGATGRTIVPGDTSTDRRGCTGPQGYSRPAGTPLVTEAGRVQGHVFIGVGVQEKQGCVCQFWLWRGSYA